MRRLYVLVDKHLDPVYGCVQGGHAVAQYLLEHPSAEWRNDYLIYLSANLDRWIPKLSGQKISVFYEPDLGGRPTALAIESDGQMFKSLRLVK